MKSKKNTTKARAVMPETIILPSYSYEMEEGLPAGLAVFMAITAFGAGIIVGLVL